MLCLLARQTPPSGRRTAPTFRTARRFSRPLHYDWIFHHCYYDYCYCYYYYYYYYYYYCYYFYYY
eukprot:12851723-Heterocapsa_arctica.AAC.1